MADTLISKLGGSREITVRSINTVRKFGGLEQDALAAGRELGVDSILDGNIQIWGDRIRVSARFVRISDGKQLWADQFDEKFTDIFAVQDSISQRVFDKLRLQISGDEKKRLTKRDTENVQAYQFYLLGRYHTSKLTLSEIRKGISYYQQAIEADPLYALVYANQGYALITLPMTSDVPPKDAFPKAKAAAQKALEIDDSLAEAHHALGWIHFWFDYDWVSAEKQMKRAIELNPNSAEPYRSYAHLLSNTGRHDEAVAMIKKAREIDPLSLIGNALEGMFLFYAGREDEAITRLNKAFELNPNFWVSHINLAKIYINRKQYAEALAQLNKAKEFSGNNSETISLTAYALAKFGNREQALAVLKELESISSQKYVPPYNIAMIYNGLGERDKAFEYLARAFEDRDVRMIFLKIDPKWNDFRDDPRFIELIKRMNFE